MKIISLNLNDKYIVEISKYYQSQIKLKNCIDVKSVTDSLENTDNNFEVLIIDITESSDEKLALIAEAKKMNISVIVLSTNYEIEDRERYILLGANIVLKIPCSTVELIHTSLAVSSYYNASKLVDSNFTIDLVKRKIYYKEKELMISSQVFDLIVIFVENTGKVLSREQLLKAISPCKNNSNLRNVDTLVKTIRKETNSSLIQTVRCSGYVYDTSGSLI